MSTQGCKRKTLLPIFIFVVLLQNHAFAYSLRSSYILFKSISLPWLPPFSSQTYPSHITFSLSLFQNKETRRAVFVGQLFLIMACCGVWVDTLNITSMEKNVFLYQQQSKVRVSLPRGRASCLPCIYHVQVLSGLSLRRPCSSCVSLYVWILYVVSGNALSLV